jgi:O-antigen/teichoic acid export membrane protein
MNQVKTIGKNISSLGIAHAITLILGSILVIFIARYLGDIGYGKYSFAVAFTALFSVLSDLGLSTLTIRDVARDKSQAGRYLGQISALKVILAIVTLLLIVIVINALDYPRETTVAVYIIGASVIIDSFTRLFFSITSAFEKMEYEAAIIVLRTIILFSLVLLVIHFNYGLISIVSSYLAASIFSFVLSIFVILKKFAKPKFETDLDFWRKTTKEALPFALTAVFCMVFFRVDIVMLSVMKGDAVTGWYYAACNIISALLAIPGIYGLAIFPVLSKYYGSARSSFDKVGTISFKFLLMVGLPISVGISLLAEEIILLVYGSAYLNSAYALQIIVWVFFINCIAIVPFHALNSANKQHLAMIIQGISASLDVLLNLLLIPMYGLIGAASATVIAFVFNFLLYFYFCNRYVFQVKLFNVDFVKIMAAGLVMGLFVFYYSSSNLFLVIASSAVIYLALLILTKALSKEDLSMLKGIISG